MFCPQCGSTQNDDLKFCKSCGANLQALRQVMASRETNEGFDWTKTWVAEMFMTHDERDRSRGITSEMKRQREIKAGVITASVGVGLMLLLFVLMEGVIRGGGLSQAAIEILGRIWIVGVIPFLVGSALIFNGVFVSKRGDQAELTGGDTRHELQPPTTGGYLSPANTNDLGTPFSVTDSTTRHLKTPRKSD